jgi:hypothetical protein
MNGERDYRNLLLEAGLALSSERSLPANLQRIVELGEGATVRVAIPAGRQAGG